MTNETHTPDVWDREGYLGCGTLNRPGEPVPTKTVYVERNGAFLRYIELQSIGDFHSPTAVESTFHLTSTDRRKSQFVMEDDTPERQEALKQALLSDRWQDVVPRG